MQKRLRTRATSAVNGQPRSRFQPVLCCPVGCFPAAPPSPGATALTDSWITISPSVQPSRIPVIPLCLPWAQSDSIPAAAPTAAAPGAAS